MKMTNSSTRFGWVSITNHWLTAVVCVAALALGLIVDELPNGAWRSWLFDLHKSLGVLIAILTVLRLGWFAVSPGPGRIAGGRGYEPWLARMTQVLLWIGLFGLPLSGWATVAANGQPVSVFGWFDLPALAGHHESWRDAAEEVHEVLANLLIGALALHVLGALKHHIVDRDATLWRMLPAIGRRGAS
jgi:cytochrome b561